MCGTVLPLQKIRDVFSSRRESKVLQQYDHGFFHYLSALKRDVQCCIYEHAC
jgi:hypothetical protein